MKVTGSKCPRTRSCHLKKADQPQRSDEAKRNAGMPVLAPPISRCALDPDCDATTRPTPASMRHSGGVPLRAPEPSVVFPSSWIPVFLRRDDGNLRIGGKAPPAPSAQAESVYSI